jgi:putative spermidine/putrescine transport system ATP-binding protein/spermidine/putrescine transport system ATP-binding protein
MMAAGFVEPDSGRIVVGGRDITDIPPYQRTIGVVFQSYALFPHLTVAQNIAFPLRMRGQSKTEQQRLTTEALELVRLSGFEERYPRQLSGGQQQRVALARALVFNPPLVLMDEPLGALDKNLRKEMQFELRQLLERLQLTILYVTHDQEEALTLSDRVVVMRDGRIEQFADAETIYNRPSNAFVASFIGETNLIPGTLVEAIGRSAFQIEAGPALPLGAQRSPATNGRCLLALRPERIDVRPATDTGVAASDETVDIPARITGVVFLGDAWSYELAIDGGHMLRAKQPADRTTAHVRTGDPVRIRWGVDDALLLESKP